MNDLKADVENFRKEWEDELKKKNKSEALELWKKGSSCEADGNLGKEKFTSKFN